MPGIHLIVPNLCHLGKTSVRKTVVHYCSSLGVQNGVWPVKIHGMTTTCVIAFIKSHPSSSKGTLKYFELVVVPLLE